MIKNTKYLRFLLLIFILLNLSVLFLKVASAEAKELNSSFKSNLFKNLNNQNSLKYRYQSFVLPKAQNNYKIKKDIKIAVIDTGIDPHHPIVKNSLWLPNKKITSTQYGVDFSKATNNVYRPVDKHGHGTHIAGIIKNIFPSAKLLILKYYNPLASGQDNLRSTIKALRFAIKHNVDIINYSG